MATTAGVATGAAQGASAGSVAGPYGAAVGAVIGGGLALAAPDGQAATRDAARETLQALYRNSKQYKRIVADTKGSVARLNRIANRPEDELDPYQRRQLEDTRRRVQAGLTSGSARGNPRALAAGFDAVDRENERQISFNRGETNAAVATQAGRNYAAMDQVAAIRSDIAGARAARDLGTASNSQAQYGQLAGAGLGLFSTAAGLYAANQGGAGGNGFATGGGTGSPYGQASGYLSQGFKYDAGPSSPTTLFPMGQAVPQRQPNSTGSNVY